MPIRIAMSNSFGFGGTNGSLVLRAALSAPLRLELSPSPRLALAILGLHGAAAAGRGVACPAWPGGLLAAALLALGAGSAPGAGRCCARRLGARSVS